MDINIDMDNNIEKTMMSTNKSSYKEVKNMTAEIKKPAQEIAELNKQIRELEAERVY